MQPSWNIRRSWSECEMSSGEWLIEAQACQSLAGRREGQGWQLCPWVDTAHPQCRSEEGAEEFSSLELNNWRCSLGAAEVVNLQPFQFHTTAFASG